MRENRRTRRIGSVATATLLGLTLLLLGFRPADSGAVQQGTLPWKPAPGTEGRYLGSETCLMCHEDMTEGFAANPHHGATARIGHASGDITCEACHGPGDEHANAGGDPERVVQNFQDAATVDAACQACHAGTVGHAMAAVSRHAAAGTACTSCHQVHATPVADGLVKAPTPDLCFGCHPAVKGQFAAADRHRLNQGVVDCESCHNPHGSPEPAMLARPMSQGELCTTCHIAMRGPFVYQHPAGTVEGCVACHQPHGGANRFMLKTEQVRELCISCHIDVPTFHDVSNSRYRVCTNCHAAIHGSDTHRLFFRR
jgi:DmsE family decaheme c-type cytochrome